MHAPVMTYFRGFKFAIEMDFQYMIIHLVFGKNVTIRLFTLPDTAKIASNIHTLCVSSALPCVRISDIRADAQAGTINFRDL